jgi:hypothetical protein
MKTEQSFMLRGMTWEGGNGLKESATLVLAFGPRKLIFEQNVYTSIKSRYPNAIVLILSTAFEIVESKISTSRIVVTAIQFDKTILKSTSLQVSSKIDSRAAGRLICDQLSGEGLKHILLFSDGYDINGDDLVDGLNEELANDVIVSGGFAGSDAEDPTTYVGLNEDPKIRNVAAIGFFGSDLNVANSVESGWDEFGPTKIVTSSEGNMVFSLDGENVLDVYKRYLGNAQDRDFTMSIQHFPLCILKSDGSKIVRSVFRVDEDKRALVFSGNVPKDSKVRFMIANADRLIDGAMNAAERVSKQSEVGKPELVLIVSCVGRSVLLLERTEEEIEVTCETMGRDLVYSGFYSNGELSPATGSKQCSLHNQTISITTYSEN